VKKYNDCVLVLAGSPATDDPEGAEVLNEVREFASNDPDVRILLLPPFSDKDINALQRIANRYSPEIGQGRLRPDRRRGHVEGQTRDRGRCGRHPAANNPRRDGFPRALDRGSGVQDTSAPEQRPMAERMGQQAREFVRQHFLITRQVRDHLAVWFSLSEGTKSLVEL